MTERKQHSKSKAELSEKTTEMIAGIHIAWSKSKEEIWTQLEQRIEAKQPAGKTVVMGYRAWLAVAATVILLAGIAVIMQVYTKTTRVPAGKHSSILLPDGTHIQLNAQSSVTYKPLLWNFSRKLRFEGEAYFEVEPGRKFEVISEYGKTTVLGTSFNIYARNKNYLVTCVTGRVMVTETQNNKTAVLYTGQKAVLKSDGSLNVFSGVNTEHSISWINNMLSFTSTPLSLVFEEIGRQYDVVIRFPGNLNNTYTGTFKKSVEIENSLKVVCRPFNLSFTRISKNEYIVTSK
ncbi:MAG: FecR domain-containing protein [Bacteroidales bacterium]|nr:FecR domain-containing protein [Bacteroidales bacterium]MBN2763670.1 FecR domain-containing protein [Bacteroidales bacterium]